MNGKPETLAERAADAGMDAMKSFLAEGGAGIEHLVIILQINDGPPDEPDMVTAGSGIENEKELIALLTEHLVGAAREIGIHVDLIPIKTVGQG